MTMSDQELAEKAAKYGDAQALRTLLDRHYHTIYKMAYRWCGHVEDAEDVAQEACIKIARNIGEFRGSSAFTTWFYPIVLNTARDLFRANSARRTREAGYVETSELAAGAPPTQEDTAIHREALAAVAELADDLKSAILLVAGEGLSHKEAGDILGCAEGTISWRIAKAREQLTRLLGEV